MKNFNNSIVVDEKIFRSAENVRMDFVSLRKATQSNSNVTYKVIDLSQNDNITLNNIYSFVHFHSDNQALITLTNDDGELSFTSNLLTISGNFTSINIKNESASTITAYIIYNQGEL